MWIEPNHPRFVLPEYNDDHAASGTIYRGLYLAARRGLKAAGQSHHQLLFGETAPRGTARVIAPLRFLRQALCLMTSGHRRHGCHELHVDAIAHHPRRADVRPARPRRRHDRGATRLVATAERAHAIGRHTPVSPTEFGIQSLPDPYVGVWFTTQAEYRSMAELAAHRHPRVNLFSQYLLRDDQPRPGSAAKRYVRWTAPNGTTRLGPLTRVHRL